LEEIFEEFMVRTPTRRFFVCSCSTLNDTLMAKNIGVPS